jgi:hypothetical protein
MDVNGVDYSTNRPIAFNKACNPQRDYQLNFESVKIVLSTVVYAEDFGLSTTKSSHKSLIRTLGLQSWNINSFGTVNRINNEQQKLLVEAEKQKKREYEQYQNRLKYHKQRQLHVQMLEDSYQHHINYEAELRNTGELIDNELYYNNSDPKHYVCKDLVYDDYCNQRDNCQFSHECGRIEREKKRIKENGMYDKYLNNIDQKPILCTEYIVKGYCKPYSGVANFPIHLIEFRRKNKEDYSLANNIMLIMSVYHGVKNITIFGFINNDNFMYNCLKIVTNIILITKLFYEKQINLKTMNHIIITQTLCM